MIYYILDVDENELRSIVTECSSKLTSEHLEKHIINGNPLQFFAWQTP